MSESFDQDRAERAISGLLSALGEDLERDGLRDTPRREFVLRPWLEIDPEAQLTGFGAVKVLLAALN